MRAQEVWRLFCKVSTSLFVIVLVGRPSFAAQELPPRDPRLLGRDNAKTSYSFAVQQHGKEFRFEVQLNDASVVTGVSVFRDSESVTLQTLPMCGHDLPFQLFKERDADRKLLKHADLNFDGFEDLELLQYYIPHLDKSLYCVYLWNSKTESFVYSQEISDIGDPIPHPQNNTITGHEEWQGGDYQDSSYRWIGGHAKLIEQDGLYSKSDDAMCGFIYRCNSLIGRIMVTTLEKSICSKEEMQELPQCPAVSKAAPRSAKPKSIH